MNYIIINFPKETNYYFHDDLYYNKFTFSQIIELPQFTLVFTIYCGADYEYDFVIRNFSIDIFDVKAFATLRSNNSIFTKENGSIKRMENDLLTYVKNVHHINLFHRQYEAPLSVVTNHLKRKDIHTSSAYPIIKKWYGIDKTAKELFFQIRDDKWIEYTISNLKNTYVRLFGI